jgi:hypothetical protein
MGGFEMPDRRFADEVGDRIEDLYSDVVRPQHGGNARGGCMAAVYNGALSALYGDVYAKGLWKRVYREAQAADKKRGAAEGASNTVDRIMDTLRQDGRAGDPWVFKYTKSGSWECETPAALKGLGVEAAIGADLVAAGKGWYFYGASASAGYHSVVVGVHCTGTARKLYWLDQFSDGLQSRRSGYATGTTEVTLKLDATLASVGTDRTRLWPLYVAS